MNLDLSGIFSRLPRGVRAPRFAAFDIDGTSVGVLVTQHATGRAPAIVFSQREDLPLRDSFDAQRNMKDVLARVEGLGREVARRYPGGIGTVAFFLTSPYVASQTRIISTAFDTGTLVTDDLLSRLVRAEVDAFEKTELAHFKTEGQADTHSMLEAKVMSSRLNGYETSSPVGKKTRQIELALYASIVAADVAAQLRSLAKALFPDAACELHSRSFALFHAVRHISPEHNYMIIDIRGEVTEMTVVKDGVLIDTISHPIGENSLFRTLAAALGTPLATAASTLSLLATEAGHEEEHARIRQALARARLEWLGGLGLILKETLEDYLLPAHMYVYANKLTGPFFKDFLGDTALHQYTPANTPFRVTLIDAEFFGTGITAVHSVDDVLLLSLASSLDALYSHTFV